MIRRRFLASVAALAASLGIRGAALAQGDGATNRACTACPCPPPTSRSFATCHDGLCWHCPPGYTFVPGSGLYPRCESPTRCTRALCAGGAYVKDWFGTPCV